MTKRPKSNEQAKKQRLGSIMTQLTEQSVMDLARSATALGKVIEAHSDDGDVIRRVVVELPEWVQNQMVRQSVAQLWQENGFVASVTKEGLLIIDGVCDVQH